MDIYPAFVSSKIKFYFSIGDAIGQTLNKIGINWIEYNIVNQGTDINNIQTFNSYIEGNQAFPSTTEEDNRYGDHYIILNTSNFKIDTYYKIQLRFTATKNINEFDSDTFTEWSSVCLLKKINKPKIEITGLGDENKIAEKAINMSLNGITGKIINTHNTNEYVKNYKIILKEKVNDGYKDYIISDYFSPVNKTYIQYMLPKQLREGRSYSLIVDYITSSGYHGKSYFYFKIVDVAAISPNFQLLVEPVEQIGAIKLTIKETADNNTYHVTKENVLIRRASSETNFEIWENIHIAQYNSNNYNQSEQKYFTWQDRTIKSGTIYKYKVTVLKKNGWQLKAVFGDSEVSCVFDDIYLMGENRSLKIKLNPSISNFKYKINESLQETINSRYPFIQRNGMNFYRTFSIGGLIASDMDANNRLNVPSSLTDSSAQELESQTEEINTTSVFQNGFIPGPSQKHLTQGFTSFSELIGADEINTYNVWSKSNQFLIYESRFRELVEKFLYDDNVKLYRSATEGNYLIKLMNISLTPQTALGRQLYSFTAEAIEVDEYSIANCDKYNIQPIGQYLEFLDDIKHVTGQIRQVFTKQDQNTNLIKSIKQDYKQRLILQKGQIEADYYTIQVKNINNLNIEITSMPYPIMIDNNEIYYADGSSTNSKLPLGYILEVNGKKIAIPAALERRTPIEDSNNNFSYVGKYYFPKNFQITSLKVIVKTPSNNSTTLVGPRSISAFINYSADIIIKRSMYYKNTILTYTRPGQLWGSFEPNKSLFNEILRKNNYQYTTTKDFEILNIPVEYFIDYSTTGIPQQKVKTNTDIIHDRKLDNIFSVSFETLPNAVVYTKLINDDNENRHVLGNGFLNLRHIDEQGHLLNFENFYFHGIHLKETSSTEPRPTEYILVSSQPQSFEEIVNPQRNGVYTIALANVTNNINELNSINNTYIYYNDQWFPFDANNNDVLCPVDAAVNYYYVCSHNEYMLI